MKNKVNLTQKEQERRVLFILSIILICILLITGILVVKPSNKMLANYVVSLAEQRGSLNLIHGSARYEWRTAGFDIEISFDDDKSKRIDELEITNANQILIYNDTISLVDFGFGGKKLGVSDNVIKKNNSYPFITELKADKKAYRNMLLTILHTNKRVMWAK